MNFDYEAPYLKGETDLYSINSKSYKHLGLICYSKDLDKELYDEIEAENRLRINSKIDLNEDEIMNEDLDEEDIHEALDIFVKQHCFYRKKPLKILNFSDLQSFNCYRYVLQTFTESRKASYTCQPYNPYYMEANGYNFGCDNPWNVRVKPKKLFSDEIVKVEIPGTSYIENCDTCQGHGSRTCEKCRGNGKKTCNICKGSGYSDFGMDCSSYDNLKNTYNDSYNNGYENYRTQYQIQSLRNQYYNYRNVYNSSNFNNYPMDHIYCIQCNGKGSVTCNDCDNGEINCQPCNSTGKVRWYVEMEVIFETFEDELIDNKAQISEDIIFDCCPKQIYFEQSVNLKPIKDNVFFRFNRQSKNLINTHLSKFSFCKIIAQRQSVYLIPITGGYLRNKSESFLIYGTERKVYFPNYPGRIKCNIL
ncbi:unnamed protein product [Brachionus calyciflorus]|uniref:Uncharacterized protein n=1 Tax=Brachionus calyciflorus TaxID=104777 RepID=A0A813XM42_9BILA|nr:unnamed protein product [Brachionus calyciflorus]